MKFAAPGQKKRHACYHSAVIVITPLSLADRYAVDMSDSARETDVHDLSLGAVEALELIPLHKLADDQLRHLYAALVHACNEVDEELASRSDDPTMDDTVNLHVADIDKDD